MGLDHLKQRCTASLDPDERTRPASGTLGWSGMLCLFLVVTSDVYNAELLLATDVNLDSFLWRPSCGDSISQASHVSNCTIGHNARGMISTAQATWTLMGFRSYTAVTRTCYRDLSS